MKAQHDYSRRERSHRLIFFRGRKRLRPASMCVKKRCYLAILPIFTDTTFGEALAFSKPGPASSPLPPRRVIVIGESVAPAGRCVPRLTDESRSSDRGQWDWAPAVQYVAKR